MAGAQNSNEQNMMLPFKESSGFTEQKERKQKYAVLNWNVRPQNQREVHRGVLEDANQHVDPLFRPLSLAV